MTKNPTDAATPFAKTLKLLRQQREWSQAQVAGKIGVDAQRISKYERGVLYPTTDLAIKLADLFEVSLDYLLRDVTMRDITPGNPAFERLMHEIEHLPHEKQQTVMALLEAFIKEHKFEELARS